MRVRWFGPPWPSAELRAPICFDNQWRIEAPVGVLCLDCDEPIEDGDRGIAMSAWHGASQDDPHVFVVFEGAWRSSAVASHIDCHVGSTAGPEFAGLVSRRP